MQTIWALLLLLVLLTSGDKAVAAELEEFYRGVRAMGMGNAFTAFSDGEDAVFYNPAGLAFNKKIELSFINPKIESSADNMKSVSDIRSAAGGFNSTALNKFFGKHLHAQGSVFPSVHLPRFALGYYYAGSASILGRNTALPVLEATALVDKGVVGGTGFEFRGISRKHFLRLGTTIKWIQRQGFRGNIPFTRLVAADSAFLKGMMSKPASGFGIGFGLQYEIPITVENDLILASSWQDIGDTRFGGSLDANRPPPIRNNLAAGVGFVHHFGRGKTASEYNFKVSAEMRHLTETNRDPILKSHFGMELQLGDLAIQGGLNQDSLGGGVTLDLGFIRVGAVTYGVETQSLAFMDRERRYMLQIALKFDMAGMKFTTNRDRERRKHPRNY